MVKGRGLEGVEGQEPPRASDGAAMRKYAKNIPTLRGYIVTRRCALDGDVKLIIVHCPFCDQDHAHGFPTDRRDSRYKTHRRPHCLSSSAFAASGYYVALERKRKS